MSDLNPQWTGPDGSFKLPPVDSPPPTKKEQRDWKYALVDAICPRPHIPTNARTSNVGVIGFETDDDATTQMVLDFLTEQLLILKNGQRFKSLVWNATEEHYRTRWTRFQMIGDHRR